VKLKLASDTYPGTKTTPVVLLHGGGQTRHAWGATARALSEAGWTTTTYDLRGHGESDWAPDGDYSIVSFGRDIRRIARDQPSPPVLIGASLGGMSSMAAIAMGAPAAGLVLVDIAHRMVQAGGRRVVEFMGAWRDGFASPEEAADAVAEYLPHRVRPRDIEGLMRNLRVVDGRYHWHWDPAMLDMFGSGETPARASDMAAELIRGLDIPMLLVRGSESDVVTEEIADEFAGLNEHAEVAAVEGARHMVAGDENTPFTAAVLDFLERRIPG
jgi:pimeloyl-ACP methyl ester carboxylesterase